VGFGKSTDVSNYEAMKSKVLDELKRIFNPEFLNRVDETIVFKPLGKEEIARIVEIRLREVQSRLTDRSVKLEFTDAAKNLIVEKGYDPILGARPLQRSIQRLLEDPLSEEFLKNSFHDGETIRVDGGKEELVFSSVKGTDATT
jgi:ATP-dependent Clp protease ATP-binding subunit ClpC